ncbi:endoribonuclease [Mycolicibacter heraklionensis]|uniref:Endoribonuclease n=1 Tax=Mycolicibacter heraklionensis TaxID=512402 RepID=A0A9X7ZHD2_9MYCO|nr:RidA family protein [Mycolicibacter heraklionensis]KLO31345.1 endoribonuclease [Mycolicibacter heraklionensis]QZA08900.1 RidA family protein [Mycolicibacter heraklionensis]
MQVVIPEWMQPIYDNFHYAPAVIVGDQLRCSGMIGIRPDLSVPEDPTEQITLAFENLRGLLGEVGLTFADVVEMTTYHVGLSEQIDRFVAVKDTFVSAPYPAWTAVGISELAIPGAVVEIRITARLS